MSLKPWNRPRKQSCDSANSSPAATRERAGLPTRMTVGPMTSWGSRDTVLPCRTQQATINEAVNLAWKLAADQQREAVAKASADQWRRAERLADLFMYEADDKGKTILATYIAQCRENGKREAERGKQ